MSDSSAEIENSERRQYFRIDMEEELVDVLWLDNNGEQHRDKITCVDFSRGGVRICCAHELPAHSEATVVFQAADPKSQRLHGRVLRSIKQNDGKYEIALKLDE